MTTGPLPELSRPVRVADLRGARTLEITAKEGERAALARRFGLLAVERLTASLRVAHDADGLVRVQGSLEAEVRQACVVTLEPVVNRISATVERLYGDSARICVPEDELVPFDGEDPPDPVVDGAIDLGEAVAEQLGLEIDPFPRAPGVEFDGFSTGGPQPGPFDALAGIKGKTSRK